MKNIMKSLRLKDKVDLIILEEYGFVKVGVIYRNKKSLLAVNIGTRKIFSTGCLADLALVYNLIKKGLLEVTER